MPEMSELRLALEAGRHRFSCTCRPLSKFQHIFNRQEQQKIIQTKNYVNISNLCYYLTILVVCVLLVLDSTDAAPSRGKSTSDSQRTDRQKRAATARLDRLWDDAVIPYEIDPVFSDERASLFRAAMRHWENHTCIKFVERSPDEHINYIVFTERSCGCCSFVGKRGNGGQPISIGKDCDKFGIVVHELGHVVGFWHEHTRPDRDQHVQIIGKNIMANQEYNFNKLTKDEVNSLGLAYDYDSILHYATNTFAKDTYLDTILPLHGHLNTEEVSQATNQLPYATTPSSINIDTVTTTSAPPLSTLINNGTTNPVKLTNRLIPNTNQTNPLMINDEYNTRARRIAEIRSRIESDFQSMLQFDMKDSKRMKRSSQDIGLDEDRIMILDGSGIVVSLAANRSHQDHSRTKRNRSTRETSPVDFDDGHHMLSTDNMLAKTRPEIGQRIKLSLGDIAQTNLLYKCPKCGRTIQQLSGIFHSNNYYHHMSGSDKRTVAMHDPQQTRLCEWRLSVGLGERIMIDIVDLDIALSPSATHDEALSTQARLGMPRNTLNDQELHETMRKYSTLPGASPDPLIMNDECTTDYLEIRDGFTYRAPLIAKLCGQFSMIKERLRPIVSTSNRLIVTHRSSSHSSGKRGFLAQHETICGGLIMLGGATHEPLGSSALEDVKVSSSHQKPLAPVQTRSHVYNETATTSIRSNEPPSTGGVPANGSPPSENEVLLSSQINQRNNQHQSQQSLTPASQRIIRNNLAPGVLDATPLALISSSQQTTNSQMSQPMTSSTTTTTPKPDIKTFTWDMWPIINSTVIQSPNWPEHYRPSRECLWQIKAEENHQISLKFDAFDLESHDSCAYDYVEVRDGDSLSNDVIGRYCGSRVPEQVLSSGANMLVKFVSDSDVNKAGFIASLQLEVDECKLGTHGCSYKCSNSIIPYKCECPNGLELAPDGRNCIPTCGGFRNETTGVITSPAFPDLYPISTKCVWEIHAPAHHKITLNFTHFDLEGFKAQECDYDFVEVWSRLQDGKYVRNGIYCGPNQGFSVTSIENNMRMVFNSDNSIQKSGFDSNYFIDRDECATNNGGCQHICTNIIGSYHCSCNNGFVLHENKHDCIGSHCLHTISSPEGTFQSPNFPSIYQPNKECAWIFSTAPGHRIRLIFDQFDLESHQECAYDHVAVFDGETMDDHLLGRFCGSRKPLTLVSSYNLLYLLFRSDATNERRGFNATHSTICGGRLQASSNQNGLIFSHATFDGTTHYNRNEDCDWIIEANENQRLRVEFTFFSLEADNNCNYDQTIIYDGPDDSSTQLARLCGTEIPKDQMKFTSTSESMLIVFKSDDSINSKGFSLVYTAIESNEDETLAITYPQQTQHQQPSHQTHQ